MQRPGIVGMDWSWNQNWMLSDTGNRDDDNYNESDQDDGAFAATDDNDDGGIVHD